MPNLKLLNLDLIDRAEAAALLKCAPNTLAKMAMRREGPPFMRVGRKVVYQRADVVAWARQQINASMQRAA